MNYIKNSHVDDLQSRSQKQIEKNFHRGWRTAALLMMISLSFIITSYVSVLSKNLNVEVDFVRIDGVVVQETVDVRREVLLKNVRQRQALGQVDEGDENE